MRRQRYHGLRIAFLAVSATVVAWWWTGHRPFAVAVEGSSMAPTILEGDLLIATVPTAGAVAAGSLVVVEHPARPGYEMVKRVIRTVDSDGLWLEGDNASNSSDSRSFGPVERDAIRGVVWLRYWPLARAGRL
jgi:nickel-type superoxide dismutase maturation protease